MSIYTRLVSGLIFPLQEKLKGHTTVARRRELECSQWLSREEIDALQLQRLRSFLTDISQQVPYYRELFAELAFAPTEINEVSDLARLPFLDKKTIRENTERLKSDRAGKLSRFNTGGSSGEPLIFYLGNERVSHDVAAKWRATRWWGVDIGDPEIVVWGSPIELKAQDRARLLRDQLFRSTLLSAFDLNQQNLDGFIADIRRIRPKMLFGYPSVITMIAQHARDRRVAMDELGIKVVFCTSECLYDHQRETMQEVFGCPVANGYGGRDAGFIAHQCADGGMHISAEDLVLEIVDESGKPLPAGESGEIVVTNMATSEFPFVRYRTGDVGVISTESCPCGRGLPMLEKVLGRTTDFVVAQDGSMLHGLSLIYVMRETPGVDAFKIIQSDKDNIKVQIVKDNGYQKEGETTIESTFKQRLGSGVSVEFEYLQSIAAEKSGKYRYVISHAV